MNDTSVRSRTGAVVSTIPVNMERHFTIYNEKRSMPNPEPTY